MQNLKRKFRYINISLFLLCEIVGLTYCLRLFGDTEYEVIGWGQGSIALGFAILILHFKVNTKLHQFLYYFVAALICIMQGPAIALWILFHGSGISDGTPQSAFIAHWAFSLPHVLIMILSITCVIFVKNDNLQLDKTEKQK